MDQPARRERRQHPRFPCEGKAEIRVGSSPGVFWGTLTDLSLGGCYIELASPLPVGSLVHLTLTVRDTVVSADGKVTVVHPMVGMGLTFTAWSGDQFSKLQSILAGFIEDSRLGVASAVPPGAGFSPTAGVSVVSPAAPPPHQTKSGEPAPAAMPVPATSGSSTALRISPQTAYSILDQVIKHLSQKGVLTTTEMLAILKQNSK
jgi:hypothetical protein